GVPAVTPLLGEAGEEVGAVYAAAGRLNRKQLVWLLPTLLSLRGLLKGRGTFRRTRADGLSGLGLVEGELQATGSYGGAIQMLMGDVAMGGGGDSPRVLGTSTPRLRVPDMDDYTPAEKLRLEREVLGFAVTHNVMELYAGAPGTECAVPSDELSKHAGREVEVAGVIVAGRSHTTRAGERMLFCSLQDAGGLIEVVLFPEAYKVCRAALANGGHGPYLVRGRVQVSGTGRGVGIHLPEDLRSTDAVSLRMHPVVIAEKLEPLA
ncbi:MAG: hypothetical protein M3328_15730, partial [Chloroflexota bacterium]|nr:hypothetical protein [Chloroflexota bacterium]